MLRRHSILLALGASVIFTTPVVAAPLTLWFKLDETTGTVATDSSGSGNNGTYTGGPTLGAAAPFNLGAYFPSDNIYVIAPASTSLNAIGVSNADFSVAFWVKPAAATGGWRPLLHKGGADFDRGPGIWLNPGSNRVHFRVSTTANNNEGTDSNADLPYGAWSHVACVKAGNKWRCYINGVLDTELTLSGTTIGNNGPLYVGDDPWYGGSNAYMDDVRLYSGALTDTEIKYLYGFVGNWKFSEGSGATAADSSGLANTATLSGGATWETTCGGINALTTNGSGAIAQTNASFTPPSVGTVAFWMRGAGDPGKTARILGLGGDWEIRQIAGGSISFDLGGSPYAGNELFSTLDPVCTAGRWYHIAAVFDDTDNSYSVYIDGKLRTSGISPVDLVPQSAGVLSFGTRTGTTDFWNGALRDVRIYSRKLAATEIAELSGLVGYWKLDETSGTTASDSSGAGNDGTYTNGPTLGVPAPNNLGAYFPSNDKYMIAPASSTLAAIGVSNADFTVAFWVKPVAATGDWRPLLHKGSTDNERGPGVWLNQTTNRVHFRVGTTSNWNEGTDTVADLTMGAWSHIACVKAGNKWRCYINGNLDTEYMLSAGTIGNNGPLYLGDDPWYGGSNACLDDVHVYNRALCTSEVLALYGGAPFQGVRVVKWIEIQ
jgi:hypothetical protein